MISFLQYVYICVCVYTRTVLWVKILEILLIVKKTQTSDPEVTFDKSSYIDKLRTSREIGIPENQGTYLDCLGTSR